MVDKLKTALLVTFIAVLVWVFAEGESLTSRERQVDVSFEPGDERRLVRVVEGQGWTGRVVMVVEGSISSVDRIEDTLRSTIVIEPGMEEVPASTGEHQIDLRDVLRAHPDFRDRGVTILRVEPQRINIEVDEVVQVEMPVRVVVPEAETQGEPTPSRDRVRVQMPGRLALMLPEEPEAAARIDPAAIERLTPGRAETIRGVQVELPEQVRGRRGVRPDPQTVDVSLTLRSRVDRHRIPTVPVHVRLPALVYGQYQVDIDPEYHFLSDLELVGPARIIEQIRQGELPAPVAVVTLTPDELERGIETSRVSLINIPPGVEYTLPDRVVRLRITRLERGGPNGDD